MNLSSPSNADLTGNLRMLQRSGHPDEKERGEVESRMQEIRTLELELETQRRALEKSTTEMEAAVRRYCDLYDHLPIGYITLNRAGRIIQANLTAAGWLRRDRSKLIGGYFSWFLDAFDAGRFAGHLETCVRTGTEQVTELTLRVADGLLLTVQLTSRPAPEDAGEPLINTAITNFSNVGQVQAIAADIEHEREAYKQAVANPGGAPLPTVSKLTRALLRDHAAELPAAVQQSLERIKCAAIRLEATFQDLLDFCCLGREEVVLDPVNLDELVQQVVVEQRAAIQRDQAEVEVERPLPCVRGARLLLGQVLANVVSHMLRNNIPGCRPRIRISAMTQGSEVVLTLLDEREPPDGEPNERSYRAFERGHERESFWRTGVGLAVVRRIIARMNGQVNVESGVGKRTSVSIVLPAV